MTELTLRWDKFGLSRGLHEMLTAGELVDVTLACQGEVIQAHKTALAACSPHFKHLFTVNPCQHPIVFMQDVNLDHLRALLQFMYTGEATVHQQELPGFLRTAEALRVSGLTPRNQDEEVPATGAEETAPAVMEMSRQARPSKRPRSRVPADLPCAGGSQLMSGEMSSSPLPGRSTDESSVGVVEAPQPLMLEPEEIKVESDDDSSWMELDNLSAEQNLQTSSEENLWHAGPTEPSDSRQVKRVKRNSMECTSQRLQHTSMPDTSSPTSPAIGKSRKQTERPLMYSATVGEQEPGSSGLGALGLGEMTYAETQSPLESSLQLTSCESIVTIMRPKRRDLTGRDFKCNQCPKAYRQSHHLRRHELNSHGDWQQQITCDLCGRTFGNKNSFLTHMTMRHTGKNAGKIYNCALCHKSFLIKSYLVSHQKRKHHIL